MTDSECSFEALPNGARRCLHCDGITLTAKRHTCGDGNGNLIVRWGHGMEACRENGPCEIHRRRQDDYAPIPKLVTFAEAMRDEADERPGDPVWKMIGAMARAALSGCEGEQPA